MKKIIKHELTYPFVVNPDGGVEFELSLPEGYQLILVHHDGNGLVLWFDYMDLTEEFELDPIEYRDVKFGVFYIGSKIPTTTLHVGSHYSTWGDVHIYEYLE